MNSEGLLPVTKGHFNDRLAGIGLFPESAMYDDGFCFDDRSDDYNPWLLRPAKGLTAREEKIV